MKLEFVGKYATVQGRQRKMASAQRPAHSRQCEILLTPPVSISFSNYKVKDHSIPRATKLLLTSSRAGMCIIGLFLPARYLPPPPIYYVGL